MRFGKTPNKFKHFGLIFSLFVILFFTLVSLWDIIQKPGVMVVDGGDDILITWIINQTIQKFPNDIGNIFQGNIFHPYSNTLAYSDLFVPSAIISFLPVKLTGLPILAFNFNLLVGQFFTIFVIFLFFKEITKDNTASLLGAVSLGISQLRVNYYGHLQMWNMYWWLLACLTIYKFTRSKKVVYLYFGAVFSAIQMWESILPVYFIVLFSVILLLPEIQLLKKNFRHLIIASVLFLMITFPLANAYYKVFKEFSYLRPIREAAHFSMSLNDPLGASFSPGLYSLLIISLFMIKKDKLKSYKNLSWIVITGITSFILSLGPVLKWGGKTLKIAGTVFIPLPYGILYYILPGFRAFRTPSRWFWLFGFCMSMGIAFFVSKYKSRYKKLIYLFAFIIIFFGGKSVNSRVIAPKPENYPNVYFWLKNQPGDAIIELPIYTWGAGEASKKEFWRMLYSLEHKKALVNGSSAFYPPEWERRVSQYWTGFPGKDMENYLISIGVDYIIIHKDEMEKEQFDKIIAWGLEKLVWQDEHTRVYKL